MPSPKKIPAATKKDESPLVSESFLAEKSGYTARHLRRLVEQGIIVKKQAGFDLVECLVAIIAHMRQGGGAKSDLATEKLRNARLDAEAKERTKKKDEGDWIESAVWLDKIDEHLGALREALKTIFLLEQPATLSGRSEVDIRELNGKTFAAFCRRMQNAAGKLKPES